MTEAFFRYSYWIGYFHRLKQKEDDTVKKYVILAVLIIFCSFSIHYLHQRSALNILNESSITDKAIRSIPLDENTIKAMKQSDSPGEICAMQTLDQVYGGNNWKRAAGWEEFSGYFRNLFSDMERFPLDQEKDSFGFDNSWAFARTYGGKRTHEGTDIMPPDQKRDYYKVYSVSDGVISNIGWLPQGGWRVGITAPNGTYFYYAHLSSYADIAKGDEVKAGDFIGYMGDTGYSEIEGTTGNFPVHLHFGIYFIVDSEEVSVNPYWILQYFQQENQR